MPTSVVKTAKFSTHNHFVSAFKMCLDETANPHAGCRWFA